MLKLKVNFLPEIITLSKEVLKSSIECRMDLAHVYTITCSASNNLRSVSLGHYRFNCLVMGLCGELWGNVLKSKK